jgi:hypothetical protein
MSIAMAPGVTPEQMQRVMGDRPAVPASPPLQQGIEPPPAKRARVKGGKFKADDPATPDVDEAWESEN